jgi:phospholipid/cholesterol/gamma-HCH transport system substrate-binding protein
METRANYVLIGICTLVAIVAGLGFFIWLAKFQIDRQYAYYDVLFDNVSGLNRAAEVRFSGLTVGQVQSLDLADDGTGRVRVRLEVDADTPVRQGATAQLQAQGVTGLSFVSISPGDPNTPLLRETTGGVPEIPGQRSVVQSLTEDAPDLLQESIKLVREFQNLVGGENQAYVASILANVEAASGKLETAMQDFSAISQSVSQGTGQISAFTAKLEPLAASLERALGESEQTLAAVTGAFTQAETTLAIADGTLKSVGGVAQGASTLINDQAVSAVAELQGTIVEARAAIQALSAEAKQVLAAYGGTAELANARLTELESTLADLDVAIGGATTTMTSVDAAATSFTGLVEGDGKALVSDARVTLETVNRSMAAIEQAATVDLPAIMTDLRGTIAQVNRTIDQVSGDVTKLTGDIAPLAVQATATLEAASRTFADASAALDRLEPAIAAAEQTLTAAQGTFTTAERIIETDVAPATADIRASAEKLNAAIAQVSEDLPAVTGELRTTMNRATATVDRLDRMIADSAGPVGDFTTQGLPQFTRFTQEARELIARLDRIAGQLERDPARFFLGAQAPDFRR